MIADGKFRKSSHSQTSNCVEVAWTKSTRSGPFNDACVEVRCPDGDVIQVRDSKDPDGPVLGFTRTEWAAFVAGVKDGQFDLV